MISVSSINEFVYCPRRYYYLTRLGLNPTNEHLEEGKEYHKRTRNRLINELFFQDEEIGLKGKIDYLTTKDRITLFEIKKAKSTKLWENDKLQLLAYQYLTQKAGLKIHKSYVKYSNGKKFQIEFDKENKNRLRKTIQEMNELNELPPKCENPHKCHGCNLKQYCWL